MDAMACISKASVTTKPLKPNSFRNSPVRILGERVAGVFTWSKAGTDMCAVMMASAPCWIAARKGTSSKDSIRSFVSASFASYMWLSSEVSPCPGKCLGVAKT